MYRPKSHAGCEWTGLWVGVVLATTVAQVALLVAPEDRYWLWYHTSTDVLELAMSLALFSAVPYTRVSQKVTVAGLVIWQLYCAISQFISDYLIATSYQNGLLMATFTIVAIIVAWLMRFSLCWRPSSAQEMHGKFYEIIGRPSNLTQLVVAMYTGRGGSFAITDGSDLWCYSRQDCCMIRKKLNPGYMVGKMSMEICKATGDKYVELDSMTGRQFSSLHNCLELQTLAGKWR